MKKGSPAAKRWGAKMKRARNAKGAKKTKKKNGKRKTKKASTRKGGVRKTRRVGRPAYEGLKKSRKKNSDAWTNW